MISVAAFRSELTHRAQQFASARSLPHCLSYGPVPTVCFQTDDEGRHGNFHQASFRSLMAHPDWRKRLRKVHTSAERILPRVDGNQWRELDTCLSSDALLMNVFCHPSVIRSPILTRTLGLPAPTSPQFGFPARVPLGNGGGDRTEVDMKIGNLLVEAKLTESHFQHAKESSLLRCRDFLEIFDADLLPRKGDYYGGYQLIRNVLAAHANQCSFCVLLDARRPDLIEMWYSVMKCVKPVPLRTACKVLTWQELSRTLPTTLQSFLSTKYGI